MDGDEIGTAFSVPRMLRLEYRLNQMSKENAPLERVRLEIEKGMEQQARVQEEVGGPFVYASITGEGFKAG